MTRNKGMERVREREGKEEREGGKSANSVQGKHPLTHLKEESERERERA